MAGRITRITRYSTILPVGQTGGRRTLGSTASLALHVVLLAFLIHQSLRRRDQPEATAAPATERPIQLAFAPRRPEPTPRRQTAEIPQLPAVPLTPGPDQTPGSTAQVSPTPEPDPNAPPNSKREEATRPDPGAETEHTGTAEATKPLANPATPATPSSDATRTLESEARRIFGRPSSKLGPVSGSRDNRPWETDTPLSQGCTLPPPDPADSTVPQGMAVVSGKIYRQDNGQPLPGARLQILGTPYGTFSNSAGEYRLVFDRTLVDRCRTQSVRVTAPGYTARDVILYLGERLSSDVPLSRY